MHAGQVTYETVAVQVLEISYLFYFSLLFGFTIPFSVHQFLFIFNTLYLLYILFRRYLSKDHARITQAFL